MLTKQKSPVCSLVRDFGLLTIKPGQLAFAFLNGLRIVWSFVTTKHDPQAMSNTKNLMYAHIVDVSIFSEKMMILLSQRSRIDRR